MKGGVVAPGKAHSWADHCKALEIGDEAFGKGLASLTAYATAIKGVTGSDYSGTDVGTLAGSVGSLVANIPSFPSEANAAIAKLGPASATDSGPIGRLAGAITAGVAEGKVKSVIVSSDKPVKEIIQVLAAYLKALDAEEKDFELRTNDAIDAIDARLDEPPPITPAPAVSVATGSPPTVTKVSSGGKDKVKEEVRPPPAPAAAASLPRADPMRVFAFYDALTRLTQQFDTARAKQAALADALQKLGEAEDKLVKAGTSNDSASEKANLAAVSGFILQVLNDVAAVRAAAAKGATSS